MATDSLQSVQSNQVSMGFLDCTSLRIGLNWLRQPSTSQSLIFKGFSRSHDSETSRVFRVRSCEIEYFSPRSVPYTKDEIFWFFDFGHIKSLYRCQDIITTVQRTPPSAEIVQLLDNISDTVFSFCLPSDLCMRKPSDRT